MGTSTRQNGIAAWLIICPAQPPQKKASRKKNGDASAASDFASITFGLFQRCPVNRCIGSGRSNTVPYVSGRRLFRKFHRD